MIQQRTGFVPPHTGQNHCSAAVMGQIKHIITKRKCKITSLCQWDPANHQNLDWSLQNEAIPLSPFYCQDEAHMSVNGWTSTHLTGCVSFTLIHFTQGSQWVHQEEAECDEGLFPQGLSPSSYSRRKKAWISSNNNQVIPGTTAGNAAFIIIIWMVKKKKSLYCVTTVEYRFDIQNPEDTLVDSDFKLLSLADCSPFVPRYCSECLNNSASFLPLRTQHESYSSCKKGLFSVFLTVRGRSILTADNKFTHVVQNRWTNTSVSHHYEPVACNINHYVAFEWTICMSAGCTERLVAVVFRYDTLGTYRKPIAKLWNYGFRCAFCK